jgi:hypothetical protein
MECRDTREVPEWEEIPGLIWSRGGIDGRLRGSKRVMRTMWPCDFGEARKVRNSTGRSPEYESY